MDIQDAWAEIWRLLFHCVGCKMDFMNLFLFAFLAEYITLLCDEGKARKTDIFVLPGCFFYLLEISLIRFLKYIQLFQLTLSDQSFKLKA